MTDPEWQVGDRFVDLSTPWFHLIGEHIQAGDRLLDYWRIEKADSLIVLPIQGDRILLPPPMYRPGLGAETWDFPGGRCPQGSDRPTVATDILRRELGVAPEAIAQLQPLNFKGWAVNSSFSNQVLYSFVAYLQEGTAPQIGKSYDISRAGLSVLLADLTCLQCRAVLLDWWCSQAV